MSIYSLKQPAGGKNQPWQSAWSPGASLANLFALYPSLGDQTIASPTSLPSLQDGPIGVTRYGNLTVNSTLTGATNRCRGRVILCDSLAMGASGVITMSALGAAGSSKWANQDIAVPGNMVLGGQNTSQAAFLAWLAANGFAIFDPTLYACPLPGQGDVTANQAAWTAYGLSMISAAGCGTGGAGLYSNGAAYAGTTGTAGSSGGTGGGGSGGSNVTQTSKGGAGRVWGGGSGSGGGSCSNNQLTTANAADQYGGQGGDASVSGATNVGGGSGSPPGLGANSGSSGGTGTGGVLIVICRGAVNLTAGHVLSANGVAGGTASNTGGAGSGGGSVSLFYSGSLTGSAYLTATGGAGGTGSSAAGGSGGAGSTQVKTFATMGW